MLGCMEKVFSHTAIKVCRLAEVSPVKGSEAPTFGSGGGLGLGLGLGLDLGLGCIKADFEGGDLLHCSHGRLEFLGRYRLRHHVMFGSFVKLL